MKTIACLGSSNVTADSLAYRAAQEVGRLLAQQGFTVATGGFGGVMEAAAKGAKEAGGTTIGYTMLGEKPNRWIMQVGDCAAQYHVGFSTPPIPEIQFGIRLGALLAADGFIIIAGGGPGTMTELLAIINLNSKFWLGQPKPLALLKVPGTPSRHWDYSMLGRLEKWGVSPAEVRKLIFVTAAPMQAVRLVTAKTPR